MESHNLVSPFIGKGLPVYPQVDQVLRVTGSTAPGPVPIGVGSSAGPGQLLYLGFVQQAYPVTLQQRDREPCLIAEPAGQALTTGYYIGRLIGQYGGLPVFAAIAAAAATGGPGTGTLTVAGQDITHTPASISSVTTLDVDPTQGLYISSTGPGEAKILIRPADNTTSGVVTTIAQTFDGLKRFIGAVTGQPAGCQGIEVGNGPGAGGYVFYDNLGGTVRALTLTVPDVAAGNYNKLTFVSAPDPFCQLQALSTIGRPYFSVGYNNGLGGTTWNDGKWATVSGLTFCGGLYVSGSVTVASIPWSGVTSTPTTGTGYGIATIDNIPIGSITPSTGTFSTLTSANVSLTGGTINGTVIGGVTPAAGSFTSVTIDGNTLRLKDADNTNYWNILIGDNLTANRNFTLSLGNVGDVSLAVAGAASVSGSNTGDQNLSGYATLASPALTGVPTAPTAAGGTNTTQIATTAFVTTAVAAAVAGLLDFKGATDCSASPNYPAALKGDAYIVSVAGKIGGASGTSVDVGDWYIATADNAGGTEAGVGASWGHMEHNLVGALLSSNNLSDVASVSAALSNLGGTTVGQAMFTLVNPSAITFLRINADNSVTALDAASFRTAIGAGSGTGDVVGPASATDEAIARFDSTTGKLIQNSSATLSDAGAITAPFVQATSGLSALYTDVLNNVMPNVASFIHTTSATPIAGFGVQISYSLKSTTTSTRIAGDVSVSWVDPTDASRKVRIVHNVYDTAIRECMRMEASGTAAMLGFLGATAVPQQTGDVGAALVAYGLITSPVYSGGSVAASAIIARSMHLMGG